MYNFKKMLKIFNSTSKLVFEMYILSKPMKSCGVVVFPEKNNFVSGIFIVVHKHIDYNASVS